MAPLAAYAGSRGMGNPSRDVASIKPP